MGAKKKGPAKKKPEKAEKKPAKPEKKVKAAPEPELELPLAAAEEEVSTSSSSKKPARRASAEAMGAKQRDISVSEFFTKNRHLLGFDNPAKALLTTVKEAVDNALDACEEAGILPDLLIEIQELSETRFKVIVEDNGPGIVKPQIPKIFAKLLYGSKFHRLRQSLTADQPVVVERDGTCERVSIGELVDRHIEGDGEAVADVSSLGMRVPAFDPQTLRYEWRPLSHVIRHERHNEVLEVRTQDNRCVRVTGCHSLFAYEPRRRRAKAIEARELKPGTLLVAPRRIPDQIALRLASGAEQLPHPDDICALRVESVERVECEDRHVYDLSVPGCENFVAGEGLLACHNSRGQQGIGISAAGLYAQLTTGKPVVITSKTGKGRPAFKIDLRIDTKRNQPDVVKDETVEWEKDHGTRVELELTAAYRGGRTGVQEYLEQTVVANPHLELEYRGPKGAEPLLFPRVSSELPREPDEIKPHPHGVELGMFMAMLQDSPKSTVKMVLQADFSRVGPTIADAICTEANVPTKKKSGDLDHEEIERLHKALGTVKVKAPPSSCVVPIGEELLVEGLKRRFPLADFYISTTRPPSVYRGNPFVVEVGLAFGGQLPADEPAEIMRFANRVPLQYQPKACAISESVYDTNWRLYTLQQPKGSLPVGPLAIAVHMASVWVPFTSEAKEAVAHYDELLREMKLALQECGRKLGTHLRAREKAESEHRRLSLFQRYIPEVAEAMGAILESEPKKIEKSFFAALPKFVRIEIDSNGAAPAKPLPPPSGKKEEEKKPEKKAAPKKKKGRGKKDDDGEQLSLLGD